LGVEGDKNKFLENYKKFDVFVSCTKIWFMCGKYLISWKCRIKDLNKIEKKSFQSFSIKYLRIFFFVGHGEKGLVAYSGKSKEEGYQ
jgi:hypothetical protein